MFYSNSWENIITLILNKIRYYYSRSPHIWPPWEALTGHCSRWDRLWAISVTGHCLSWNRLGASNKLTASGHSDKQLVVPKSDMRASSVVVVPSNCDTVNSAWKMEILTLNQIHYSWQLVTTLDHFRLIN